MFFSLVPKLELRNAIVCIPNVRDDSIKQELQQSHKKIKAGAWNENCVPKPELGNEEKAMMEYWNIG